MKTDNRLLFSTLKDEGNELIKSGDYLNSLSKYMNALKLIDDDDRDDRLAIYKNLSLAYLKLENYDNAIINATKALELRPNDVKALYRRCQSYQLMGKYNDAFKDAITIQRIEPNNTLILPLLRELNIKIREIAKESESTSNRVQQMLKYLSDEDNDLDKRLQSANNLITLSREKAAAEMIIQLNGLEILLKCLKSKCDSKIKLSCIRTLSEMCNKREDIAMKVFDGIGIEFLIEMIGDSSEEFVAAIQYAIQMLIDALVGSDAKDDKKPNKELLTKHENEIDTIMTHLIKSCSSRVLSPHGRDSILELIIKNVEFDYLNWGHKLVDIDGLYYLLDIASELEDVRHESSMNISSNTRTHVSIALDRIYLCMDYDRARERYRDKVMDFINSKLKGSDIESKVRATAAITVLCQGPLDVGNDCLAQKGVIEMMLVMAQSEDEVQQKVAAEAIIAAASKKDKCTSLASMGAGILKNLYKSNNDSIKVRALVGLCKLGSVGGTDASIRPFADGSTQKLASACRKYLIDKSKEKDSKKWAAEGLAYLTLDADVKEELIDDRDAITALIELALNGGVSVLYGVVTTLVNLTNSYDKQEVIPELKELAKFAKQHVPEDHPKDTKEYIDKRCKILTQLGVTTALVALSKSESKTSREMMCRVFNAICEHQELRGTVVQQGGAKALLKMAIESNTENGKHCAGQSLARIGITINPEVAFPGQRCAEVVGPIMALLHIDCSGLQNFEALMALTNLAQVSDSVRKRILKDNGFSKIEHYMYEEHEMIKRAATQCIVNLILTDDVVKIYEGENDRVKYLVVLSEDDDLETVKAASGALAMLTSVSKKTCEKIFDAKHWYECLIQLISSKDPDLQHRGVCIIYNMVDSGDKIAEKIVETKIFEILMAIARPEVDDIDEKIKDIVRNTLQRAEQQKLIAPYQGSTVGSADHDSD